MAEISEEILKKVIKKRESQTHKGDYGRVLLIGGSENYGGAILMATEGTINSGTGLTAVATHPLNLGALHARLPEAMFIDWRDTKLADLIKKMDVVICGPGLGMSDLAKQILVILRRCISEKQIVVLDASALDLISQDKTLLPTNAGHLILTPHQMEWQRLSQIRIPFQTDSANIDALNQLIPDSSAILVLKSNHTHIYDGTGQIFVNPIGNPGMATGGMGDTLAGIIGGLVAQFGPGVETIQAAVYLHSLAGDLIAKDNYVVRPTELSKVLPKLMKKYSEMV